MAEKLAGTFGRSITELKGKVRTDIIRIVDVAAKEVLNRTWNRTPVDTGYARSRWQLFRLGDGRYKLVNDAPYIIRLEYGYSKQAPNGMLRITAEEWPAIVSWAVRRERRK